MPSNNPTPSRLPLACCLVIAIGSLALPLVMADWKLALLESVGIISSAAAAFLWCRHLVRRRAAKGFIQLRAMAGQSSGTILPEMPDEWPEAAIAAQRLQRRFAELESEGNRSSSQLALLRSFWESLPDGFVATDAADRILALNSTARRLLGLSEADFTGRQLAEVVRIPTLHQGVGECRRKRLPILRELRLGERSSRVLNAHCAPVDERDQVGQ